MIKRLAHACMISQNLEETERFYCQVLGLKKKFDFFRNGHRYGMYVEVGEGSFLEFFYDFEGKPQGRIQHVSLEVENLDSILERLSTFQVEYSEKKLGADESWQAWLRDPDGIRIELQQYTSNSHQYTGKDCHT